MIKIKNRNHYDIIYQCLIHCKKFQNSQNFPTTKTKFYNILGGNSKVLMKIFSEILVGGKLIEINPDIEYYRDVYKITQKGEKYIEYYEKMKKELLLNNNDDGE